jgi:glutathione S-transferase
MPPILYSFRRCPYAMRARMALLAAGVRFELREVILRDKPMEMLALSPKGTVPVLVLPGGRVIEESLDIMHWALAQHDPLGWLNGSDAALIAQNDGAFKYHLDRTKYPDRHGSDTLAHRAEALRILDGLEARLARNAYLCGPAQTLSDVALFPFIRQFAAIDAGWFAALPLPRLQDWLARHSTSPLFDAAMIRLPQWRAGDAAYVVG